MMDMSTMGSGMMIAMSIYHLALFGFAVLGIAASIISALLILPSWLGAPRTPALL